MLTEIELLQGWVVDQFSGSPETIDKLIYSFVVLLILWIVKQVIVLILNKRIENVKNLYNWKKSVSYCLAGVGLFIISRIWFREVQSVATFLGLLSAGLAIALKDVIANIAGWVYILWERPFDSGDRIQIGEAQGDVIDIGVFKFTILEIGNWVAGDQSTGRMIRIPNALTFSLPVSNSTSGFPYIWNEIPILVTYESNWRKAKDILTTIVDEQYQDYQKRLEQTMHLAKKEYMITYTNLTPKVYTSIEDSGILLTIRYLCYHRHRRGSHEKLIETILDELEKESTIELAYPTTRLFTAPLEAKEKLRPR